MKNSEKQLNTLLTEYPEFRQAYYNDATVHAWMTTFAQRNSITLSAAMTALVVQLVKEKKHYFDGLLDEKNREMPKGIVL